MIAHNRTHHLKGFLSLFFLSVIAFVFFASPVAAAVIHGTIYDLDLHMLPKTVVDISTLPKQRMVSSDGTYNFTVDKGTHVIRAKHKDNATLLSAEERVVIKEEGSYVFDLFLLPSFEGEEEIVGDISIDVENIFVEEKNKKAYLILGIATALVLVVIYLFYKIVKNPERRRKKEAGKKEGADEEHEEQEKEDEEKQHDSVGLQVLSLLRQNEGRLTQKELRKNLPLSEAKISLVLTDLEAQEKIRKIKKGRGNIVILSKGTAKTAKKEDTYEEKDQS